MARKAVELDSIQGDGLSRAWGRNGSYRTATVSVDLIGSARDVVFGRGKNKIEVPVRRAIDLQVWSKQPKARHAAVRLELTVGDAKAIRDLLDWAVAEIGFHVPPDASAPAPEAPWGDGSFLRRDDDDGKSNLS